MSTYTVNEIVEKRHWDGNGDAKKATDYWTFRILGDEQLFEIGRKPDNPLSQGDSFEAETVGEGYGKIKLKRVQPQGSFGGGGNKRDEPFKADPSKQRSIARQHAQKVALAYAQVKADKGDLPQPFNVKDLLPVIDWLYEDVMRVTLHEDEPSQQLDEALGRSEAGM